MSATPQLTRAQRRVLNDIGFGVIPAAHMAGTVQKLMAFGLVENTSHRFVLTDAGLELVRALSGEPVAGDQTREAQRAEAKAIRKASTQVLRRGGSIIQDHRGVREVRLRGGGVLYRRSCQ